MILVENQIQISKSSEKCLRISEIYCTFAKDLETCRELIGKLLQENTFPQKLSPNYPINACNTLKF